MTTPILELRTRTFGIEHAEGSAKIPQRKPAVQVAEHAQRVVKPCEHDLGRCVLVTTHLAKVNGNPARSQFAPRLKRVRKLSAIDHDSLTVFQRPGRQWLVAGQDAAHPLTLMMREFDGMVGVAALQDSGPE